MLAGQMIDAILALWRSATTPVKDCRSGRAAPDEADAPDACDGERNFAGAGMERIGLARPPQSPHAADGLLALGMASLGLDADAVRARDALRHADMERSCMACTARSRCRRDLATGDFARRYRHYCLNRDSLAALAAGTAGRMPI